MTSFEIENAQDLDKVIFFANNHDDPLNVLLKNDIIATYWQPIVDFYGTFDGQGHTISGLRLNNPSLNHFSFIGRLTQGGVVKNLNIKDTEFVGDSAIGGIVGTNEGTVENCTFSGTIQA